MESSTTRKIKRQRKPKGNRKTESCPNKTEDEPHTETVGASDCCYDPHVMRDFITHLYPEAMNKTIFVPPLHFNRVSYRRQPVPETEVTAYVAVDLLTETLKQHSGPDGGPQKAGPGRGRRKGMSKTLSPPQVLWSREQSPSQGLKKVQENNLQDDFAQNHVLANFQALGESLKEPMFILPNFSFDRYLDKLGETPQLPMPKDLNTADVRYSRLEADIVVVHRRYGMLIVEIKSIGRWHKTTNNTISSDQIVKRVERSLEQLQNLEEVICHVLRDLVEGLTVRKTLCLPYVNCEELKRVLYNNCGLSKAFLSCFPAKDLSEAVNLCLCADQLSDPDTHWDVTPAVLSKLSAWWRHRMATNDPHLCGPRGDERYLDIVARFVGPASTVSVYCVVPPRVEVRTAGQALAELGQRLSRLVLTPQQLDVLSRDSPLVCFTGPPGTGKTVLLVLKALQKLQEGVDVHIVSTRPSTLASSHLIERQLQVTLDASPLATPGTSSGRVHVHHYAFYEVESDVDQAIRDLTDPMTSVAGPLCVVMDEVTFHAGLEAGPRTVRLLHALYEKAYANSDNNSSSLDNTPSGQQIHNSNNDILHSDVSSDVIFTMKSPGDKEPSGGLINSQVDRHTSSCINGSSSRANRWRHPLYLWSACVVAKEAPEFLELVPITVPLRATSRVVREVELGMRTFEDVQGYHKSAGLPAPGDGPPVVSLFHQESREPHTGAWPVDCCCCGQMVAAELRRLGVGPARDRSPIAWQDVFILTRSSDLRERFEDESSGKETESSPVVAGLRAAGVPVVVLEYKEYGRDKASWAEKVRSVARAEQDAVTVSNLSLVHGLERRLVVWLAARDEEMDGDKTPAQLEARDRLYIFSRCSTQLVTVSVTSPPKRGASSTEGATQSGLTTTPSEPASPSRPTNSAVLEQSPF